MRILKIYFTQIYAFRKSYGFETTSTRHLKDWNLWALDKYHCAATDLIDLRLDILLCTLSAYGIWIMWKLFETSSCLPKRRETVIGNGFWISQRKENKNSLCLPLWLWLQASILCLLPIFVLTTLLCLLCSSRTSKTCLSRDVWHLMCRKWPNVAFLMFCRGTVAFMPFRFNASSSVTPYFQDILSIPLSHFISDGSSFTTIIAVGNTVLFRILTFVPITFKKKHIF